MLEPWQEQVFLVALIVGVFVAFVKEWFPVELVALVAFFLCIVAGILPLSIPAGLDAADYARESSYLAFSVFAHPAPITVACMFVLSAALERTGVVEALGSWFEKAAAATPFRMLVTLLAVVAFLSAFVNNTPVVVVFMPIILGICRRKDWRASRFLIPLSYAAIVGGTITIVGTSTNMVAAGTWQQFYPEDPFTMFEFAALGLVFVAVAMIYMTTIGRGRLPDRVTLAALIDSDQSREFITHAFVREKSNLVGSRLADTQFGKLRKARVLEVQRNGRALRGPLEEVVFEAGDELLIKGRVEGLVGLRDDEEVQLGGAAEDLGVERVRTESAVLMEGILGRGSSFEGKSLKELDFERRFGVFILAVHRRGRSLQDRFDDVKLAFGDTLLVQGPAEKMRHLFRMKDFINLSQPQGRILRWRKAPLAIFAIVAFMALGALSGMEWIPALPVPALAMGAALFVLVTRCLDPQDAYEAVEWKVLFLIMGMLGLGKAVSSSGLDRLIGEWVSNTVGTGNPVVLVGVLYILAAILTEVISNNAVAALLAPVAIGVGVYAEVDPKPLVAAIMFGASASFVTPIGYQTNTFVYGAGGYKFGDFFRVGLPLTLILWVVSMILIPMWWPL